MGRRGEERRWGRRGRGTVLTLLGKLISCVSSESSGMFVCVAKNT